MAEKRKGIGKRLRFEIFKRDRFMCMYCGANPHQKVLRVDHVKPVADGGTDDQSNLITSCFDCNAGKAGIPLDKKKYEGKIATEEDREHAEQIREWLATQRDVLEAKDDVTAYVLGKWEEECGDTDILGLGTRLRQASEEFGVIKVSEAIEAVGRMGLRGNDRVKYFHGCLRKFRKGEPAPSKREPVPTVATTTVHQKQANAAIVAAVGQINAASQDYPTEKSRVVHVYTAFARAARCSRSAIESINDYHSDYEEFEVRGLEIRTARADGFLRFSAHDVPDFDAARSALDEISNAIRLIFSTGLRREDEPEPPDPEPNLERVEELRRLNIELRWWLELREEAQGNAEFGYVTGHVLHRFGLGDENFSFVERWGIK